MFRAMNEKEEAQKQIVDQTVTLLSIASMLEAMDQGTAGTVNLQTYAAGEIARMIQKSTMAIMELVDILAAETPLGLEPSG